MVGLEPETKDYLRHTEHPYSLYTFAMKIAKLSGLVDLHALTTVRNPMLLYNRLHALVQYYQVCVFQNANEFVGGIKPRF